MTTGQAVCAGAKMVETVMYVAGSLLLPKESIGAASTYKAAALILYLLVPAVTTRPCAG